MSPRTSADGLAADQRGAILITAVMMGAVLAAAVLYVLDVGQAIVVRERLQDAADATAFEAAVWHARGMNAAAVLNILMSVALAVMAVTRQIELICLIIPGGEGCAEAMLNFETRAARYIDLSMDVLQNIQLLVAVETPVLAQAIAGAVPGRFDHDGDPEMRGSAASLALMPVAIDKLLQLAPRHERAAGTPHPGYVPDRRTAFPARLPDMLGDAGMIFPSLPLQSGSFGELCGRASSFIADQQQALLDRFSNVPHIGRVISFIGGTFTGPVARPLLRWAGRHFSDLLCRPAEDALNQVVQDIAGEACDGAERHRESERDRIREENDAHPDRDPQPLPDPWSTRDQEACEDDEEAEARERQQIVHFDAVPAELYELAENGNPFLHTWSMVREVLPDEADPQREPHQPRKTVAEAEYYFDCDDDCSGALWRPGWTARMRRFRMPYDELDLAGFAFGQVMGTLREHAESFIAAKVESTVEDMLTGAACRGTSGPAGRLCNAATTRVFDPITDWIKKKAEDFVAGRFSTGDGAATETVGGAGADGADWGINWLIDWGLDHATDFAADHGLELHDTRGYGGDRRIH